MRKLCWGMFFISLITAFVSVVLLLNITAPNPTSRRYASSDVITTGAPQAIGSNAEHVLSLDLGIPNNNDSSQRHCICNNATVPGQCNTCMVNMSLRSSSHRLPDFVTDHYIADSKNVYKLMDADQIADFALAAHMLGRPLWIFVRVDSIVDASYHQLVESTGGGIVYYFPSAGYQDPVDQAAKNGLAFAGGLGFASIGMSALLRRSKPNTPQLPKPPKKPKDPFEEADDALEFIRRRKDRAQSEIDQHDHRWN